MVERRRIITHPQTHFRGRGADSYLVGIYVDGYCHGIDICLFLARVHAHRTEHIRRPVQQQTRRFTCLLVDGGQHAQIVAHGLGIVALGGDIPGIGLGILATESCHDGIERQSCDLVCLRYIIFHRTVPPVYEHILGNSNEIARLILLSLDINLHHRGLILADSDIVEIRHHYTVNLDDSRGMDTERTALAALRADSECRSIGCDDALVATLADIEDYHVLLARHKVLVARAGVYHQIAVTVNDGTHRLGGDIAEPILKLAVAPEVGAEGKMAECLVITTTGHVLIAHHSMLIGRVAVKAIGECLLILLLVNKSIVAVNCSSRGRSRSLAHPESGQHHIKRCLHLNISTLLTLA